MDITELSERLEKLSVRYGEVLGFERDADWFLLKLQEEMGELTQAYLQHTGRARTKGLTSAEIEQVFHQEFADVFCQLLLLARRHDVDLPAAIEKKWLSYEDTPPSQLKTALSRAAPEPATPGHQPGTWNT